MALENNDVLENLKEQLTKINADLTTLTNTRYKLLGAIEVLEQIESSKVEVEPTEEITEEGEE
jgi:hypothetical protein